MEYRERVEREQDAMEVEKIVVEMQEIVLSRMIALSRGTNLQRLLPLVK